MTSRGWGVVVMLLVIALCVLFTYRGNADNTACRSKYWHSEARYLSAIKEISAAVDALRVEKTCELCDELQPNRPSVKCARCGGSGRERAPWPRVVTGLEAPDPSKMLTKPVFHAESVGSFVKVRVAGSSDEAQSTRLGILLGDLPMGIAGRVGVLRLQWGAGNPAIWVPSLRRIVMGYESWWGEIESPEELRAISDADIESIPYVQALAKAQGKRPVVANASVGLEDEEGDEPRSH